MGKLVREVITYSCDGCHKSTDTDSGWFGLESKVLYCGLQRLIFCSVECAIDWPSKQVRTKKLGPQDVYLMFKMSDSVRMGNTD